MKLLKGIGILIIISVISYGGYVVYNNWYGGGTVRKNTSQTIESFAGDVKGVVSEKVQTYAETAKESILKSVGKYATTLVGEALSSIGNTLNHAGVSMSGDKSGENSLIVVDTSTKSSTNVYVALSIDIGMPLSFSLPRNTTYTIEWGDGESANSEIVSDVETLIEHSWNEVGIYDVVIKLRHGSEVSDHFFVVAVRNK